MNLFTVLPIVVDDASLQVIPFADVEYLSELEQEAYGHWIFDQGGAGNLANLIGAGADLTVQGSVTHNSNYLSMSNTAGNALVTDIADVLLPYDTYCMVIRNPNVTTARTFFGNANAQANKGWQFYYNSSDHLFSRHYTASAYDSGIVSSLNTWRFVAISRNQTASERIHYIGGETPVTQSAGVYTPTSPSVPLRLGNGYYTASTNSANIDYAELIAFDQPLSIADLDVVYARSKARLAARGITVV